MAFFHRAKSRVRPISEAARVISLDTQDDLESREGIPQEIAATNHLSPFLMAARSEDATRLAAAMDLLEPFYREALLLRFQEELSLQEIAGVTGAPVTTISSRIYRGLAVLRSAFQEGGDSLGV